MKLRLERKYRCSNYCIDKLYINNEYFPDALEDPDRGLTDSMSLEEIKKIKIKGNTCIPYGTYTITLDVVSPKFSTKTYYKEVCNGKVPRLLNVKGFEGILIHVGEGSNGHRLTSGCLLVGRNTIKGGLTESKKYFQLLYNQMIEAKNKGEKITIKIIK